MFTGKLLSRESLTVHIEHMACAANVMFVDSDCDAVRLSFLSDDEL